MATHLFSPVSANHPSVRPMTGSQAKPKNSVLDDYVSLFLDPDPAIPAWKRIAGGVAAPFVTAAAVLAAPLILLSGCNGNGKPKENPCDNVDCGPTAQCFASEQGAATCLPLNDGGPPPDGPAPKPDAAVVTPDAGPDAGLDEMCTPICLNSQTGRACRPGIEPGEVAPFDYECPENTTCEEGECKTNPGVVDPSCPPDSPLSSCRVTDIHDVWEDQLWDLYAVEYSPCTLCVETFVPVTARCGEDQIFVFSPSPHLFAENTCSNNFGNWFAHTLGIDPPPLPVITDLT